MEMPKPSDEHIKLQRLVGDWKGSERLHPSPWDPKGGEAVARANNRSALDGFAVIQDYEQQRGGKVNFRGHGIFTWNAAEKCHILYWFDSLGFPPEIFKGGFNGSVLTLTSRNERGYTRGIWDFSNQNSYAYRMEVSPDGVKWQLFVEGTYTKGAGT